MSKRNGPDDHTELSPAPTDVSKKPRIDIQEQIKRASTLAAQLRDGVKDGTDSKISAANEIAGEELMRIFESLQEKTVDTSESVNSLIVAQVRLEVQRTMDLLASRTVRLAAYQSDQISNILKPSNVFYREYIIQRVQELMEDVTSGNYVAIIKATVREVLVEEYKKGTGAELSSVLDTIL